MEGGREVDRQSASHGLPEHVGVAPAAKVWKPAAHVPAEHVEPSHAVQAEIEASVYVAEQSVQHVPRSMPETSHAEAAQGVSAAPEFAV